jgi:hypothetical protein
MSVSADILFSMKQPSTYSRVSELIRRAGAAWKVTIWQPTVPVTGAGWCGGVDDYVAGISEAEYLQLQAEGARVEPVPRPRVPPAAWELRAIGDCLLGVADNLARVARDVEPERRGRLDTIVLEVLGWAFEVRQGWEVGRRAAPAAALALDKIIAELRALSPRTPAGDQLFKYAHAAELLVQQLHAYRRPMLVPDPPAEAGEEVFLSPP